MTDATTRFLAASLLLSALAVLPPATLAAELPEKIGKFPVLEHLGSGGEADVYRARHPDLDMELVIKWSREPLHEEALDRHPAIREGRVLGRLRGDRFPRVHDLGVCAGRPFLVLESVRGKSFARWVVEENPAPGRVARLLAQVAFAVQAVHEHGILHRDIKPQNILVDDADQTCLIDFGFAERVEERRASSPCGTIGYMSPEQASGEPGRNGVASDIFALGGTLYFALTGAAPYRGSSLGALVEQAQQCFFDRDALARAEVPAELRRICLKAMAERPDDRYESAEDLAEDLQRSASSHSK